MCNLQARYSSLVRCSFEVKIATDSLLLANVKSLTENFISMPYLKVQMYTVSLLWHIKQIVLYKTVFSLDYSKSSLSLARIFYISFLSLLLTTRIEIRLFYFAVD